MQSRPKNELNTWRIMITDYRPSRTACNSNLTPFLLFWAIYKHQRRSADLLLARGADPGAMSTDF